MRQKSKIISIDRVPELIPDGATIAVTGFVQMAHPEQLSAEVEKSFLQTGKPKDLTLIYGAGQGNGKEGMVNRYGHEGLLKRVIGGHYNLAPKVTKLISENKLEAYNFPQGVLVHCFRSRAAGLPGHLTHVST
jgi:propionate CoA-transferase